MVEQMKKQKVLVVEDDDFLSLACKDKLEREGFEVILAHNGADGLEKITSEKPDLVLLDVALPEKTGFEVLDSIKKDDKLKNIPVIIISNLGQESDIIKGKKLGAVDYLVKASISMKKMIARVKFHLAESNHSKNH
jgi:two-component system OmpR family response regulator